MIDLFAAVECGDAKSVEQLLAEGASKLTDDRYKSLTQNSDRTCLHLAVIRGHAKIVELLLAVAPALVIVKDKQEKTPLHFAVEREHNEITEMLMDSVKSHAEFVEVTFHAAIKAGHHKIVCQLLDHRPQLIEAVDWRGRSPLHLAAEFCHHSVVAELFARRRPRLAEVGGKFKLNLLQFAVQYGYDTIVAELLVEQPHLIDSLAGDQDRTVLQLAAGTGHVKIVNQLLAHKPGLIDLKDSKGGTPLHSAAVGNHVEAMEQLLAHKPELIDSQDKRGSTALDWACNFALVASVECLLAHGPVVNERMFWGALAFGQSPEVLELLCARKPELIASVDARKCTALHFVFGYDAQLRSLFSEALIRTVWRLSPPPLLRATNCDDQTPFHVAIRYDNKFAIGLAQCRLSLDEIVAAFDDCRKVCFLPSLLSHFWGPLLVVLDKDVVGTVCGYLGLNDPASE